MSTNKRPTCERLTGLHGVPCGVVADWYYHYDFVGSATISAYGVEPGVRMVGKTALCDAHRRVSPHLDADDKWSRIGPGELSLGSSEADAMMVSEGKASIAQPLPTLSGGVEYRCDPRDVAASPITLRLSPGSTWTGSDGTVYDVVRQDEVGGRPRWWLPEGCPPDEVGCIDGPHDLHDGEPLTDGSCDLALVLRDVSKPDLRASLRSILGLPDSADDEAVKGAVRASELARASLAARIIGVARDNFEDTYVSVTQALDALEHGIATLRSEGSLSREV